METEIDVEPFDSVDIKSHGDDPLMFEEGTIGTMGVKDEVEPRKEMEEEKHKGGSDGGVAGSWLGFLSVEYYQPFFDVTTSDVFYRVMAGMFPFPFKLSSVISSSPDLYGPFWLCMTLIFTTAISGNLSALLSGNDKWEFHFHEVIVIATVIYTYTWSLPIVLWLFLMWRNTSDRYSLVKILSIYGYSMAIFIPLTLVWVVNVEIIRWIVLVFAIVSSGAVLAQALWAPLQNETKQIVVGMLAIVLLLHSGIGIGFKFYYFGSSLAPKDHVLMDVHHPPASLESDHSLVNSSPLPDQQAHQPQLTPSRNQLSEENGNPNPQNGISVEKINPVPMTHKDSSNGDKSRDNAIENELTGQQMRKNAPQKASRDSDFDVADSSHVQNKATQTDQQMQANRDLNSEVADSSHVPALTNQRNGSPQENTLQEGGRDRAANKGVDTTNPDEKPS